MDNSLKIIERMIELVYNEIKIASANLQVTDEVYKILKSAAIDSINLQRKIEDARVTNLHKKE